MCPKEKYSLPVTKSGNASLAALKEPNPVPITNHSIAENPKKTAAEPAGMSSFLANKYFNMQLPPSIQRTTLVMINPIFFLIWHKDIPR
jgi:hypothetical protein